MEKEKDKEKKGGVFSGLKKLSQFGAKKGKDDPKNKVNDSKCTYILVRGSEMSELMKVMTQTDFGAPLNTLLLKDGLPVVIKKAIDFLDQERTCAGSYFFFFSQMYC